MVPVITEANFVLADPTLEPEAAAKDYVKKLEVRNFNIQIQIYKIRPLDKLGCAWRRCCLIPAGCHSQQKEICIK